MKLFVLVCLLLSAVPAVADYWQQSKQGWFWYVAPPAPIQEEASLVTKLPAADFSDAPEVTAHALLKRQLENSRSIAIMHPTPANLSRYLYLQKEVTDRAASFADVWQRVVWADPALDYSVANRPTNAQAMRNWDQQRRDEFASLVTQAATNSGLFFVFGPDCVHCPQLAEVLERFATAFAMEVQAVAVAGATHPAFPQAWPDNGFAQAAGVTSLPVVLLARFSGAEQEFIPIAHGPVTAVELGERIAVVTGIPVGTRF